MSAVPLLPKIERGQAWGRTRDSDRHSFFIPMLFEILASLISDELSPKYRDDKEFRRESYRSHLGKICYRKVRNTR